MEVIHKLNDANGVMSALALLGTCQDRKMEITVLSVDEDIPVSPKADIGAIVYSLVGVIPYADLTLSEMRKERLKRY